MLPSLALSISLAVLAAGVFGLVGHRVMNRAVSQELAIARNAFALWWYLLALTTLVGALQSVIAISALPDGASKGIVIDQGVAHVMTAIGMASILLVCAALAGLVYYLVFLFTNSRRSLYFLAFGYLVYYILLAYFVLASAPDGVEVQNWRTKIHNAAPIEGGPLYYTVIGLLILPPFLAAIAYLTLYFRVEDPVLKRRVLLVSLSIIGWFGSALVSTIERVGDSTEWQVASRFIGLAAAGTIYYAYAGLRPRGGEPVARTASGEPSAPPKPPGRREAARAC